MSRVPSRDLEHLEELARTLSGRVRERAGTSQQRRRARTLLREAFQLEEASEETPAAGEAPAGGAALDLVRKLDRLLAAMEGDSAALRWSEALARRHGRSGAWYPQRIRAERVTLWTSAAERNERRRRARREWLEARVEAASGVAKTNEDTGDCVALPIDPDSLADFELIPTRPRRRPRRR